MPNLAEMSMTQIDEHLKNGGTFEAAGGLKIRRLEGDGVYALVNKTGVGASYLQDRLTTVLDIADQLAPLSGWESVEGSAEG